MSGDPNAVSGNNVSQASLQSFTAQLPAFMQAINSQMTPAAQAQLGAQQATSGSTQDLQNQLYSQYAPGLATTGSGIQNQSALAGSQTAQNVLGQNGQGIANSESAIDQSINPNFYNTSNAEATQLQNLLGSINLNGLSGGETAAVERSLAQQNQQTGNVNTPSALNTVSNAMNYGNALQAKRTALGAALDTATSYLPQSKVSINPISDTLNAGATAASSNPGTAQFTGVQSNAGSTAPQTAQSLFGAINSNNQQTQQINSTNRNSLDATTGVLGSLPT